MISDGSSSSEFACASSNAVVNKASEFFILNREKLFGNVQSAFKSLIFDIQGLLLKMAVKFETTLDKMSCTMLILCINTHTHEYTALNIGDGIIAKKSKNGWETILYPENGTSKRYTFFVNSKNVFRHIFICKEIYKKGEVFFAGTDGCFENCFTEKQYSDRIENIDNIKNYFDDATYCIAKD